MISLIYSLNTCTRPCAFPRLPSDHSFKSRTLRVLLNPREEHITSDLLNLVQIDSQFCGHPSNLKDNPLPVALHQLFR